MKVRQHRDSRWLRSRRRRGRVVWSAAWLLLAGWMAAAPSRAAPCAWIEFRGMITPLSQALLLRKLERAKAMGAETVVIEIDSPGGMLVSSVEIAEHLAKIDWARTIAFVPREAISGAAIFSLACDEIVLLPSARIGDAGPIIEGEDARFRDAPEKVVSYLARVVRDLASAKGRSPDLAEAMVNKKLELVRVREKEDGPWKILPKSRVEQGDRWQAVEPIPESAPDKYLTLNGEQAVRLGLASVTVAGAGELEQYLKLEEDPVRLRQTSVDVLILLLNSWLGTGFLLFVGLVALFFELSAPGTGVGGLIAGLCFVLFFWSHFLGGTAGWLEVILFLSGLVFLAMELFVIPGFGVAGLSGILLLIASVVMASYQGHLPDDRIALAQAGRAAAAFVVAVAAGGITLMVIGPRMQRLPMFKRLVLAPPVADETEAAADESGQASEFGVVVGDEGTADTPLRPAGRAIFGEEYVDVVADGRFIDAGRPIRVIEIQGNRVVVRELATGAGSSTQSHHA